MTDLPFQRPPDLQGRIDALHDALDKSAARREELCDERLTGITGFAWFTRRTLTVTAGPVVS
jgi:hypothetical protein